MADIKIQAATRKIVLEGNEAYPIAHDPDGSPADRHTRTDDIASYTNVFRYTISVTVASNNLTVALKDLDGNTPSTTYPVRVRIGNTEHTVSAALSVTANAATNWCNAGSSELATKAVGYFVYLGYDATDGVVIGFSRIPYATTYNDFSTTSTNETFCKISTITNASAADEYENIGYFEATLSAGAGYTWSSPTGVISMPRKASNYLTWTPTWTGFSVNPSDVVARYKVDMRSLSLYLHITTDGTSNATSLTATAPWTCRTVTNMYWQSMITAIDNGSGTTTPGRGVIYSAGATITFYKDSLSGAWTAANAKGFRGFWVIVEI